MFVVWDPQKRPGHGSTKDMVKVEKSWPEMLYPQGI